MAARGYESVNATNPRGGYQVPFVVTTQILDHKDGHFIRPNMVAIKYLGFRKDVNSNVHVRVFNSIVKTNVETSKEFIINAFSYTLRDITSNWCHNYMSEFSDNTFSELTQAFCKCHQKT
jgi:hypothetical protein